MSLQTGPAAFSARSLYARESTDHARDLIHSLTSTIHRASLQEQFQQAQNSARKCGKWKGDFEYNDCGCQWRGATGSGRFGSIALAIEQKRSRNTVEHYARLAQVLPGAVAGQATANASPQTVSHSERSEQCCNHSSYQGVQTKPEQWPWLSTGTARGE